MKVSELREKPGNPRKISKGALDKLAESIERDPEFMALRPMIIDDDGTVLGGNQRLKAIKKLGMKEIPDTWVRHASDLTDEQKKRFILVDNAPVGMAGDWDVDVLSDNWSVPELEELGFDLESLDVDKKDSNNDQESGGQDEIEEIYAIYVECKNEQEQITLLQKFEKEGIECRALIS